MTDAKRTLGDVAAQAVRERNPEMAAAVADRLRAAGVNYNESYDTVKLACDKRGVAVDPSKWDALMREADEEAALRAVGREE